MDRRKKKDKNCMILHCKNAENDNKTIILSFLHFYSVKSYNFFFFFFFYIRENKHDKKKSKIFFFSKMQKFGSEDP